MKLEHAVCIEPLTESDGGGYLATAPDLPGCMSDGETPEEALKNVQEAIVSWIEAATELNQDISQGIEDVSAGRVREWDFAEFLRRASRHQRRIPAIADEVRTVMPTMEGGCHCGRVRFKVTADLDAVTICNCSICAKKGIWHLIVPPERFELISGKDDLATYQFNTKVAKHHFCKVCGIHPFYVPRSDPDKIDVNARCLDDFDELAITPKRFDGRNWEAAMAKKVPWR
jgi:predicted RNase H-like HicB family nuclease